MRAVRCEVCGSRAMTAAAQCPTCAHHFELRDGRGELFPLAYCSSCQSYYRESLGECRWCHTKPERPPIGPRVWKGVGAVALIALVITARLLQDDGSLDSAIDHAKTKAKVQTSAMPADTSLAQVVAVAPSTATPTPAPTADSAAGNTAAADTVAREIPKPEVKPPAVSVQPPPSAAVQPPPIATKPQPQSATKPATTVAAKTRRPTTRWVSSISRDWVPVRAGASKRSRLIASIGPNSRVQLGESRDGWRRIRAKGLTGWVEQHVEFRVAAAR